MRHVAAPLLLAASLTIRSSTAAIDGVWEATPGGEPAACAWAATGRKVQGTCVLGPDSGPSAGAYAMHGTRVGKRLHLSGTRPDGVHLSLAGTAQATGWRAVFRLRGRGLRQRLPARLATSASAGDPPGKWVFDAACATCHGTDARGTARAPAVRCHRAIGAIVRAGINPGGMPIFGAGAFSDAELALIQSALLALCATDDVATQASDLFASNCARCHADDAAGKVTAAGIRAPDIRCKTTELVVSELASGEANMPAFPELAGGADALIANWLHARCADPDQQPSG